MNLSNNPISPEESQQTILTIQVEEIRNNKGHILISVFNSADGFPDNKDKAIALKRVPVQKGSMTLTFDDIKPGKYAFAIVHDENDNLKLDKNMFGMPKEGFCFSKNAMGTFGPPDFKDASFPVNAGNNKQSVKISYW